MTASAAERNSSEPLDKRAPTRTVCLSWKSLSDTFAGVRVRALRLSRVDNIATESSRDDFTATVRSEWIPRGGGGGPGRLVWIAALAASVTFHPLASSEGGKSNVRAPRTSVLI